MEKFPIKRKFVWLVAALMLMSAGAVLWPRDTAPQRLGLFTSLPIVWQETADTAGLLNSDAPPHWALAALKERGEVQPLDVLTGLSPKLQMLIMAQPRPLSGPENVALDDWVRAGGVVVLFADPMLTQESTYSLGDRRRPQDIALLSPILTRWGLLLQIWDELGDIQDGQFPVNMPGRFSLVAGSDCTVESDGLIAQCRIGKGHVLAIADAALLESGGAWDDAQRRDALLRLLDQSQP